MSAPVEGGGAAVTGLWGGEKRRQKKRTERWLQVPTYAGAVFLAGPWDVFGWEIELIAMSVANQWELSLMDEPRARAFVAVVYSSPTTTTVCVHAVYLYL